MERISFGLSAKCTVSTQDKSIHSTNYNLQIENKWIN